jgi:hypothetical protein
VFVLQVEGELMVMVGITNSFQLAFKNLNCKLCFHFFNIAFVSFRFLHLFYYWVVGGDVYKFQFLCILCLCRNCCVLSILVVFFVNVWIRGF